MIASSGRFAQSGRSLLNAALEVRLCRRYGRNEIRKLRKNPKKTQAPGRTPEHVRKIYKICSASAWREAARQGVYRGSVDDARDGFIHFSSASQLAETARKHFAGQTGLFLVEVDADALGEALRWERSRNEELFPHLYGELDLRAVIAVLDISMGFDGSHEVPVLAP
jgi:uncharacterized protein (DUF952 family)